LSNKDKSLESWIWDAACSPLIFTKRLCDVFDDEINRIAQEVGSRAKAFKLVKHDKKLVRFFLPLVPRNPDDARLSNLRPRAFCPQDYGGLWIGPPESLSW